MPASILNYFSKKTKKSKADVEQSWNKAKDIVTKQYPDVSDKDDKYYQIVVGVMKKMLGLTSEDAVITTSSMGNLGPGKRLMLFKRYGTKKEEDK